LCAELPRNTRENGDGREVKTFRTLSIESATGAGEGAGRVSAGSGIAVAVMGFSSGCGVWDSPQRAAWRLQEQKRRGF
jgi:exosome complex RNA-binding protein Rrp42 (RNase PH superfamily)